jgi:hypothetical protein
MSERIERWFMADVDGCPRHLIYPRLWLLWDWVLRPGAYMGLRHYLRWLAR